jgi:SAM-dependent methyltransferase
VTAGRDELAASFDGVAEAYERARPGYADEALDRALALAGLAPGDAVVDLAAGTGKLTRMLVARGLRVTAVEPLAGMRARLVEQLPGVPTLDGTAEALPLADACAAAVLAAQAFHWFRIEDAAREIARVLRPGGHLLAIWNEYLTDETPWLDAALRAARLDERPPPAGADDEPFETRLEATGRFRVEQVVSAPHVNVLDLGAFLDLVSSFSWIATRPAAHRRETVAAVERVVRASGEPLDALPVRYRSDVYVAVVLAVA